LQLLKLLQLIFLTDPNNELAQKINLQKFAILGKVWHFAPPLPFFVDLKSFNETVDRYKAQVTPKFLPAPARENDLLFG